MPNHIHAIIQITNLVGGDLRVIPEQISNQNDVSKNNNSPENGQTQRSVFTNLGIGRIYY